MATTGDLEALIYFTTAANPPFNGLLRPEPNNPSTTRQIPIIIHYPFIQSFIVCTMYATSSSLTQGPAGRHSPVLKISSSTPLV